MGRIRRITVEGASHVLNDVRQFVVERAQEAGLDGRAIAGLELAVDEAATNIIEHGYCDNQGWIEVEAEIDSDRLIVRLRDRARPFDPCSVPEPNLSLPLNRRPIGKLGVFLMRKSVDQVRHRFLPQGGNELTLVKQLKP